MLLHEIADDPDGTGQPLDNLTESRGDCVVQRNGDFLIRRIQAFEVAGKVVSLFCGDFSRIALLIETGGHGLNRAVCCGLHQDKTFGEMLCAEQGLGCSYSLRLSHVPHFGFHFLQKRGHRLHFAMSTLNADPQLLKSFAGF